jgi:hypothetical protein
MLRQESIKDQEGNQETIETDICIKGQDFMVSLHSETPQLTVLQQRYTYNEYTVLDEPPIAQSPYCTIHLVQLNHNLRRFVMKQLRRGYMRKVDREAYLNSMREIDIHKLLKHRNVVNLCTVIDDAQDDKVYMVMEWAGGGQIMLYDPETTKFKPSRSGP